MAQVLFVQSHALDLCQFLALLVAGVVKATLGKPELSFAWIPALDVWNGCFSKQFLSCELLRQGFLSVDPAPNLPKQKLGLSWPPNPSGKT